MIVIKIKKLHPDAIMPTKAHPTDSGWDLYALEDVLFEPMETKLIKSGIAIELPEGYDAQIRPRSSMALKRNFIVTNSPGTIDNGYKNDIGVILTWVAPAKDVTVGADGVIYPKHSKYIKKGERIAQLIISKVESSILNVVNELSNTDRGQAGFGSSGK